MKPIHFKEMNYKLIRPSGTTDEDYFDVPCFRDGEQIISKWQLTQREIDNIVKNKFIWVRVLTPSYHPPLFLEAEDNIFINPS